MMSLPRRSKPSRNTYLKAVHLTVPQWHNIYLFYLIICPMIKQLGITSLLLTQLLLMLVINTDINTSCVTGK